MSEWFTSIGALVGLLSGLFLLYDRYAKGRPTASFAVKDKKGCIRITNRLVYRHNSQISVVIEPGASLVHARLRASIADLGEGTAHQLITLIQPTRTNVTGFIAGHICVPAGGGEDREASIGGDGGTTIVRRRKAKRLLAKFA